MAWDSLQNKRMLAVGEGEGEREVGCTTVQVRKYGLANKMVDSS